MPYIRPPDSLRKLISKGKVERKEEDVHKNLTCIQQYIIVREYHRGNQKEGKNNIACVGQHSSQANTNSIIKT